MIQCENVTLRYRKQTALSHVGFTLKENVLCGVLGRNGAGKTSLLSLLAAYRRPTEGRVRVLGEDPYENPRVMPQVAFIYDKNEENNSFRVGDMLKISALFRPNWDEAYARTLCERFELPPKEAMSSLSRGRRAAVHAVIGLAGRAPVTIFDEVYLGMDAAVRKMFIGELLDDYTEHPRTILFSTHYIDEMDKIFGEAIILDRGRVVVHEDCDSLRQRGVEVTGDAAAADAFARGKKILSERALGTQKEIVLLGAPSEAERAAARQSGLTLSAPSLQDLFIHMTGGLEHEE
jgi:ABC-2 type transport system ATP-binding protein